MQSLSNYLTTVLEKYGIFSELDDCLDNISQNVYEYLIKEYGNDIDLVKSIGDISRKKVFTLTFDGTPKTFYNKCTIYVNQFGYEGFGEAAYDDESTFENGGFHPKFAFGLGTLCYLILNRHPELIETYDKYTCFFSPENDITKSIAREVSTITHELMHAYEDYCKEKSNGKGLVCNNWYDAVQKLMHDEISKELFMNNEDTYNFIYSVYLLNPAECRANVQGFAYMLKTNIERIDINKRDVDLMDISGKIYPKSFSGNVIMNFLDTFKPYIDELYKSSNMKDDVFDTLDEYLCTNKWWSHTSFNRKVNELKKVSDNFYKKLKEIAAKVINEYR